MRDEWFIRGHVPMTKSEVRAVSISKLEIAPGGLCPDRTGENGGTRPGLMFDIGAGTGSVSVEAALTYPNLRIVAFERNEEALELIRKNARKAGVEERIEIVAGDAAAMLKKWLSEHPNTAPDYVFVGGSTAKIEKILSLIETAEWDVLRGGDSDVIQLERVSPVLKTEHSARRARFVRFVVNVIALESVTAVMDSLRLHEIEAEISEVSVARAEKAAGKYHLMRGLNPVTVFAFGGLEDQTHAD